MRRSTDAQRRRPRCSRCRGQGAAILQPLTDVDLAPIQLLPLRRRRRRRRADVIVSRTGYTGEDGFELYCPERARRAHLERALGRPAGVTPAGLGARDTLRLEMGMALYGNDIDDTATPLEAGLGWIVKLHEGRLRRARRARRAEGGGRDAEARRLHARERRLPAPRLSVFVRRQPSGVVCSGTMSPTPGHPDRHVLPAHSTAERDPRSRSRSAGSACRRGREDAVLQDASHRLSAQAQTSRMRVGCAHRAPMPARAGSEPTRRATPGRWARARGRVVEPRASCPTTPCDRRQLRSWCDGDDADLVLTTGGTGFVRATSRRKPRVWCSNARPPGSRSACACREACSFPRAALARRAGGAPHLIVNLPGSPAACAMPWRAGAVVGHAVQIVRGAVTDHGAVARREGPDHACTTSSRRSG